MDRPAVAAVIPVGSDSTLLDDCLRSLAAQTHPVDELILVDDSPDGGLAERPGTRQLQSHGRGPFAARNVGWRATDAEVILFLDLRSRPRPDWARRLVATFDDPTVALASSDVLVRGGASWGARAGERHRFFRREVYVREGLFRPYAPTCNLGVRRAALVQVGGFTEVRSSADVDLCWRVLADRHKRLVSLPEVLMEWVPRDRLRDYFEQCYRYGRAHHGIYRAWADEGGPQKSAMAYREILRRGMRLAARTARARMIRRDSDEVVGCLREAGGLVYEFAYRTADAGAPSP